MKQFILLIAALFALSAPALATTITISATTVPNANLTGLQAAQPITVNTSGTTVTRVSGNNFNVNWPAGMLISIGGINYTLASVSSANSLTLTASAGTQTSVTATIYPYVELRIYALQSFTASGGNLIQQGVPGSAGFYVRRGASVISNTVYLPELTLDSTLDAQSVIDRQARYFAGFYLPNGGFIKAFDGLDNFQLPASPTATTWQAVRQYNRPGTNTIQNYNAFTQAESDARYVLIGNAVTANATTGVIPYKSGAGAFSDSPLTVSGGNVTSTGDYTSSGYVQAAMRDKGGQVFDVRAYGAVCDGSTSDQTAFVNALAAADAVDGIVQVPTGTCLVTGLTVPAGVGVRGAGWNGTVIKSTANGDIILLSDTNSWVSDLTIDGGIAVDDYTTANARPLQHGVRFYKSAGAFSGSYARNVWVQNVGGSGFRMENCFSCFVDNGHVNRSYRVDGAAFDVYAGNLPNVSVWRSYAHVLGRNNGIAMWLRSGQPYIHTFNTMDGWGTGTAATTGIRVGQAMGNGDPADTAGVPVVVNSNIESYTFRGLDGRLGSSVRLYHSSFSAYASATGIKPIYIEAPSGTYGSRGWISADSLFLDDGNATICLNSRAIHSYGAIPVTMEPGSTITQYYDDQGSVSAYFPVPLKLTGTANTTSIVLSTNNAASTVSGLYYDSGSSVLISPQRFWGGTTSAGAPTFSFTSDSDTGMYNVSANTLGLAAGGTERLRLDTAAQFNASVQPLIDSAYDLGATGSNRWRNIFSNGYWDLVETAAPASSAASVARLYADSTAHRLKVSNNTGGFSNILLSTDWAAPGAIGGTTPAAGNFTTLTASTSLTINGGTAVTRYISATGTVGNGGANIAAQSCITDTITVTGAASGDLAIGTPPSTIEANLIWNIFISAADTVKVQVCNPTSGNIASADLTWRVGVIKH